MINIRIKSFETRLNQSFKITTPQKLFSEQTLILIYVQQREQVEDENKFDSKA